MHDAFGRQTVSVTMASECPVDLPLDVLDARRPRSRRRAPPAPGQVLRAQSLVRPAAISRPGARPCARSRAARRRGRPARRAGRQERRVGRRARAASPSRCTPRALRLGVDGDRRRHSPRRPVASTYTWQTPPAATRTGIRACSSRKCFSASPPRGTTTSAPSAWRRSAASSSRVGVQLQHGVLGQPGGAQAGAHGRDQGGVRAPGGRGAAEHRDVADFTHRHADVDRDVRPGLVDHQDPAERDAHARSSRPLGRGRRPRPAHGVGQAASARRRGEGLQARPVQREAVDQAGEVLSRRPRPRLGVRREDRVAVGQQGVGDGVEGGVLGCRCRGRAGRARPRAAGREVSKVRVAMGSRIPRAAAGSVHQGLAEHHELVAVNGRCAAPLAGGRRTSAAPTPARGPSRRPRRRGRRCSTPSPAREASVHPR